MPLAGVLTANNLNANHFIFQGKHARKGKKFDTREHYDYPDHVYFVQHFWLNNVEDFLELQNMY